MTAAEGTARWQAVEQVREHERYMWSNDDTQAKRASAKQFDAALSLLEQLAEAAEGYLRAPSGDTASAEALHSSLAAVRSGRASA